MIVYTLSENDRELQQILSLQGQNLPHAISGEELSKEGFLTVQHDFKTLKAMHEICPHILAKDGPTLVGYALSMHPDFSAPIAILIPMFEEIDKALKARSEDLKSQLSYLVMGQICIAKAYRRQGVFRNLYKHMLLKLPPEFNTIITEVDATNTRSLQAHFAVGFKLLSTYRSGGQEWELIYLQ